jgi:hypothetical protein
MATTKVSRFMRTDGAYPSYTTKTAAYPIVAADYGKTLLATSLAATVAFTLPDAATVGSGWWVKVIRGANTGGYNLTVDRAGSDTIAFGSDTTETSIILAGDGDHLELVSTGSGWVASGNTTVALNVYNAFPTPSAQTITTSTITTVAWGSTNRDTHGGMNLGTETYTIPLSGLYHFDAIVGWNLGTAHAYNATLYFYIDGGGALISHQTIRADDAYGAFETQRVSGIWRVDKGDAVLVKCYHLFGADRTIGDGTITNNSANENFMSINRIGNSW